MPDLPLRSPFAATFNRGDAADLAAVLRVLGDPTRLRIIHLLHHHRRLTVTDLTGYLGRLSQPTVQHHVHVLESARLVRAGEREGQMRPRELAPDALARVVEALNIGGDQAAIR